MTRFLKATLCALVAVCLMAVAVPEAHAASGSKPAKVKISKVKSTAAFKLTVKVKKAKRATGYQYVVSTDKWFASGVKKKTTAKRSYTFKGLEGNREYFVKVRAYKKLGKKKVWGPWSAVKKKTVKRGPMNNATTPTTKTVKKAVVTVRDYGSFTITLDESAAPKTVANFCTLANKGFYDGLRFHRIQNNYVIQGGDPNGDGTGSADTTIVGEFSDNNVDNELADNFVRGVVAMARGDDYDSASCQFFVALSSNYLVADLSGRYAAFGTVDEVGMQVIDSIVQACKSKERTGSMGVLANDDDKPVIESIRIVSS